MTKYVGICLECEKVQEPILWINPVSRVRKRLPKEWRRRLPMALCLPCYLQSVHSALIPLSVVAAVVGDQVETTSNK